MCHKPVLVTFVTLLVVCSFSIGQVNGQLQKNDACRARNNAPGTCRLIYECAQAITDIKAGLGRVLCRTGDVVELVCCPNPTVATTRAPTITPLADTSRLRLSERKCREYSEYVFQNETYPSLIIGNPPITRRVDKCGFKVVPLIVGGTLATAREFPHMARLGYGNLNSLHWGCGGTIISRRFILTAGHCVVTRDGEPTYVRIGDLDFDSTTDDADPKTIRVLRSIAHPSYRSNQQYHDIALLELAEEMQFNSYARPACLNSQLNRPERRAIASGWGTTEYFGDVSGPLLKVTLDLFGFNECITYHETNRRLPQGLLESQQLCAGSYDSEKDTCEGDSGGPLQVYHNLYCMYNVVGVTSFGKACGTAGLPGVYARVSNYIDWIESNAFGSG